MSTCSKETRADRVTAVTMSVAKRQQLSQHRDMALLQHTDNKSPITDISQSKVLLENPAVGKLVTKFLNKYDYYLKHCSGP